MPNIESTALFEIFQKYCNFGTRNSPSNEASPIRKPVTAPMMDGSKFAKLAREAGLIDGTLITTTEVDITFSRVKDKTERRITFAQFQTALEQLAEKKYLVGTDKEAMNSEKATKAVSEMICKLKGPQLASGTTLPESSGIIDRLMDGPANYISKTPRDDSRDWKNDLRRSPSSQSSRRSSGIGAAASPTTSRKTVGSEVKSESPLRS